MMSYVLRGILAAAEWWVSSAPMDCVTILQ